MKYVTLGPDDRAVGFFDPAINSIPAASLEISDALWQSWLGQTADVVYVAATQSLAPYVPPPPTVAQLAAYASAKQAKIMAGGKSVDVAAAGAAAQTVEANTDTASLVLLQGAASIAQQNLAQTFDWVQASGPVELTPAQILTLFAAVTSFIQTTFTVLAAVLAAINSGAITTTQQIDAASWPANN